MNDWVIAGERVDVPPACTLACAARISPIFSPSINPTIGFEFFLVGDSKICSTVFAIETIRFPLKYITALLYGFSSGIVLPMIAAMVFIGLSFSVLILYWSFLGVFVGGFR